MTEHDALMCLNAVSGLGSLKIQRLLEFFGTARAIWKQSQKILRGVEGVGDQIANNILRFDCSVFLKEENKLVNDHGINVVTFFDDQYPEYLKQIPGAPIVLYCAGNVEKIKFPGIAIVGSRRASIYGQSVSRVLSRGLAYVGIVVVSGMARGIDTAAHQGCLEVEGKTVAVLGSGLGNIYPRENTMLFHEIANSGCVISEFPMMTGPQACNFPRRNRIISGLSEGIVVVEAAARSGALITARYALEQGREVFAVPGKVGQSQAVGTNHLIQQGAKLVSCIDDVLEEFPQMARSMNISSGDENFNEFSEGEQKVFRVLSDEPIYIDDIVDKSDLHHQEILSILLKWECREKLKEFLVTTLY